jgi:hypothetical protein
MQKFFNRLLEVLSCLQIAVSPLLIGIFFGGCIYYFIPTTLGLVLAAFIVIVGTVIGIVWAIKTTKKVGASTMLNRLTHQPEFDKD